MKFQEVLPPISQGDIAHPALMPICSPVRKQSRETYQLLAVERPTTNIISYLLEIEEARHAFNLGEGIIFENHANNNHQNHHNHHHQQSSQSSSTITVISLQSH
jgi:hypothetical protein